MKFCTNCNNMLYLNIIKNDSELEEESLNYICKNCNSNNIHKPTDNSCIFHIDYNIDNIKKNSYINPYIYKDITLPRAEGIKCPNDSCPETKPEIKYIKYDKENMSFIYICLDCHKVGNTPHIW